MSTDRVHDTRDTRRLTWSGLRLDFSPSFGPQRLFAGYAPGA